MVHGFLAGGRHRYRVGPIPWGGGPGGIDTHAAERPYRTKIEILRDLVGAADRDSRKSRIISHANLNEESFSRYSSLAMQHGLLGRTPVGYRATDRGQEWVHAADRVLTKRSELFAALRDLRTLTSATREASSGDLPGAARFEAPSCRPLLDLHSLRVSEGMLPGTEATRVTPNPRWGATERPTVRVDVPDPLDAEEIVALRRRRRIVKDADRSAGSSDEDAAKTSPPMWSLPVSFPLLPLLASLGTALVAMVAGISMDAGFSA